MRNKISTAVTLTASLALAACASARPLATLQAGTDAVGSGISLYQQGKYAEAAAALQGQAGVEASAYLAASLAKQKQYEPALAPADAALGEAPTHAIAVAALGEALVGLKRFDDAVARLSAVLAKDDKVAFAYYWRGQAYGNKKQNDRMIADYEIFVKLAPDTAEAQAVRQILAAIR